MLLRLVPKDDDMDIVGQKILELDLFFRSLPDSPEKCQNFIQNKSQFL